LARLHPNLAELYRQKVTNLVGSSFMASFAALLNLANGHPRSKGTGVPITLVAGVGFIQERTKAELRKLV
jgi:hypothetical protein